MPSVGGLPVDAIIKVQPCLCQPRSQGPFFLLRESSERTLGTRLLLPLLIMSFPPSVSQYYLQTKVAK